MLFALSISSEVRSTFSTSQAQLPPTPRLRRSKERAPSPEAMARAWWQATASKVSLLALLELFFDLFLTF